MVSKLILGVRREGCKYVVEVEGKENRTYIGNFDTSESSRPKPVAVRTPEWILDVDGYGINNDAGLGIISFLYSLRSSLCLDYLHVEEC
jgi:hypothetical protein